MPKILEFPEESPKSSFLFGPIAIFGNTSGGGPLSSVGAVGLKFAVPFWQTSSLSYLPLVNFHLCGRLGRKGIENGKTRSSRLAWSDRKMSFRFYLVSLTGL